MVEIRISQNSSRCEISKMAAGMREIRGAVLAERAITTERALAYKRMAASAAGFTESAEDPKITDPLIGRIAAAASDPALSKYDSLQDGWWLGADEGRAPLDAMRQYALHQMHGGLYGAEDVGHMFQIIKLRFESEASERQNDGFILPAYGGIWVPEGYLGPLLVDMTGDEYLVPRSGTDRLTLRLDWWPDDGHAGIEQTKKLLDAAGRLGYAAVEFWMPTEHGYEELRAQYANKLQARPEQRGGTPCYVGTIKLVEEVRPERNGILRSLEFDERELAAMSEKDFAGKLDEIFLRSNGNIVAAGISSVGFSYRILLTAQDTDANKASCGFYFPDKQGSFGEMLRGIATQVMGMLPQETLMDRDSWLRAVVDTLGKLSGSFGYATIRTKGGEEINIDAIESEPKWSDSQKQ